MPKEYEGELPDMVETRSAAPQPLQCTVDNMNSKEFGGSGNLYRPTGDAAKWPFKMTVCLKFISNIKSINVEYRGSNEHVIQPMNPYNCHTFTTYGNVEVNAEKSRPKDRSLARVCYKFEDLYKDPR